MGGVVAITIGGSTTYYVEEGTRAVVAAGPQRVRKRVTLEETHQLAVAVDGVGVVSVTLTLGDNLAGIARWVMHSKWDRREYFRAVPHQLRSWIRWAGEESGLTPADLLRSIKQIGLILPGMVYVVTAFEVTTLDPGG